MTLIRRQNTLLTPDGSDSSTADWAASYDVTVYPVGAVVSGASSDTTIPVDAGHSFAVGDKYLLNPGSDNTFSGTDTVQSVTATQITMGQSVTVAAGDTLVNLGPDTGTSTPNYDASPVVIYSDADGSTTISNSRVTASSSGEYGYYTKGDGRAWELIRDGNDAVVDCVLGHGRVAGRVNVQDYGAVGDGATADTARIQAAMTTGASEVYIPAGTYMVLADSTIASDRDGDGGVVPSSSQSIFLAADATVKAIASSADLGSIFRLQDLSNVRISGGTIDGNLANYSGSGEWGMGIGIYGSTDVWISDMLITDCWGDGIFVNRSAGGTPARIYVNRVDCEGCRRQGVSIIAVDQMHLADCNFRNTSGTAPQDGLIIEPSNSSDNVTDVTIANCHADNNSGSGFGVNLTSSSSSGRIVFTGCTAGANTTAGFAVSNAPNADVKVIGCASRGDQYGVLVESSSEVAVQDCMVTNATSHGILLQSSPSRVTLTGNHVRDSAASGLRLVLMSDSLVSGNVVHDSNSHGISLFTVTHSVISNNRCEGNSQDTDATYDNIDVGTNSTNNIFTGNMCRDGGGAKQPRYAIGLSAGNNNNWICGNDFSDGGKTAIVSDAGTGNTIRQNQGWVTEASGTGSVTSGGTADVITHGLSVTPTAADISIVFSEDPTNTVSYWWVDTITSTQFTVNVDANPGASNLDFGWRAVVL